jgi:hypothetical protein
MPKLVAIGDSLTQGFQHLAISRPEWSYPAMIARALGIAPAQFRLPEFGPPELGGLPLNIERLARALERHFGRVIDPLEAVSAVGYTFWFASRVEGWWEIGPGKERAKTGPLHHNLAVWGFEVSDATMLSAGSCASLLPPPRVDLFDMPIPSEPMYRTVVRTLNPRRVGALDALTQVGCARALAQQEGKIENLILFLGANNVLPTVVQLSMAESTEADLTRFPHERHGILWRPDHFRAAYDKLASEVRALQDDGLVERVLVGTVPEVTIAPVCRGVNVETPGDAADAEGLYDYYTHFWVWDPLFRADPTKHGNITRAGARLIRQYVREYNACIEGNANAHGWTVVDTHGMLEGLRFRSTGGRPSRPLPDGLLAALRANPKTRYLTARNGLPALDARFVRVKDGQIVKGGLFGLDGIHPTTVGYGLVAEEFLRAIDPTARLDWDAIVAADTILMDPPAVLNDLERWVSFIAASKVIVGAIGAMVGG